MPPACSRQLRAPGTWRSPHSPRSWRTDSIISGMPNMPPWLKDRPPPEVFSGNVAAGRDAPALHEGAALAALAEAQLLERRSARRS